MNVSEFVLHAVVLAADGQELLERWTQAGLVGDPDPFAGEILAWLPERGPGTCISIGLPLVTFGRTGGRSALR